MSLMKSPQMESFIKNSIEVFFTDPIDEFWLWYNNYKILI